MAHRQSSVAVITQALRSKKLMTFPAHHQPISIDETEKYRQLLDKVRARMQTRTGYQRLAGLICFFTMYAMAILLQQRVEDSFSIESRCENVLKLLKSLDLLHPLFLVSL
jgi:hypothetical protein